jgi:acetylglutamate kinase
MAGIVHKARASKMQRSFEQLFRGLNIDNQEQKDKVVQLADSYRSGGGAVVKVGGSALSEQCGPKIFEHIKILDGLEIPLVIVHGGGKDIDEEMKRSGLEIKKIRGQRITDERTVEILKRVMSGIGFRITQSLIEQDIDAQHLLGHGGILKVEAMSEELLYVGRVAMVKTKGILALAKEGMVPVITPLGFKDDHVYNINADVACSKIAVSINARKIIFVTNVDGIFDGSSWRSSVTVDEILKMVAEDKITSGMIPKVEAVIEAVMGGLSASIVNGNKENALLAHLFGFNGSGTEIDE